MSSSSEVGSETSPKKSRWRGSALVAALVASTIAPVIGATTAGAQTSWSGFGVQPLASSIGVPTPGWSLATTYDLGGAGLDLWNNNHGVQSEALHDVATGGPILRATLNLGDDGATDSHGSAFADIDGDGDDDLIELSGRTNNNTLFENNNGTLSAIDAGNLEDFDGRGRQPVFFDFDLDGDLDVFISNLDGLAGEVPADEQAFAPSAIYLNNGDGTAWTDAGDPNDAIDDLNIPLASLTSMGPATTNRLVTHNVFNTALNSIPLTGGSPTVSANGPEKVTDLNVPTRDIIVGDFDGDLYPEFIAFGGDAEQSPGTWPVRAFEVTPAGSARSVTLPVSADLDNCRSGTSGDFDNDGDLDILAGCTQLQEGQDRNVVLLNDGFGNFTDAGTGALPRTDSDTAATMISADINGDGWLDAVVANGQDSEVGVDDIIINQGGVANWVAFDLDGSNPGAIGAQLFVGSSSSWQVRETGHAAHSSQDSRRLHFGLGTDTRIEPVLVQWPDGTREECTVPGINRVISLVQGAANCSTITGTTLLNTLQTAPVVSTRQCGGQLATVDLALGQTPTAGNDIIVGTNGNDQINGLGGNDVICGLDGDDTIDGGAGNDRLFGFAGDDEIAGGTGNDYLSGGSGEDVVTGNAGDDIVLGNADDDDLSGGDGEDSVFGGNGNDKLAGGADNDILNGNNGFDNVGGGTGDDFVRGGPAADTVTGGDGDDMVFGDNGSDFVFGNDGNDEVFGGTGFDSVSGNAGNDDIVGGKGNDRLNGGDGNDDINAGEGNDIITGGNGNDLVRAGTGDDQINGGNGADVLRGGLGVDSIDGAAGSDTCTRANDRLLRCETIV